MYNALLRTNHTYSRERDRKETTESELLTYLGLLYIIGIKKSHHENVKGLGTGDETGSSSYIS